MITEHESTETNTQDSKVLEPENNSSITLDETIERLAQMDSLSYDRCRKSEAKKLNATVGVLNDLVNAKKKSMVASKTAADLFPEIPPYESEVILSDLLDEIVETLSKYVSFQSDHEPKAIALWVIRERSSKHTLPSLCCFGIIQLNAPG
jgi:hypothetical protein